MKHVKVDQCLPLRDIAPLLVRPARDPVVSREELGGADIAMKTMKEELELGMASSFTCPEGHASLWESQHGELLEYCCRVGHRFSPDGLLADQSEVIEHELWSLLNATDERATLLDRLSAQARAPSDVEAGQASTSHEHSLSYQ